LRLYLALVRAIVGAMRTARLTTTAGTLVCERCHLATNFATRLRGLMGRDGLAPGEGMLFRPGGSIHTFFMRFALDVVFCDRELRVLGVARDVRPWRMAGRKGAKVVVELAAGTAPDLQPGDRLVVDTMER
jgi:uncharacterized membrane protein (UPF0127 family)